MKLAILKALSLLMLGSFLSACARNEINLVNTWKNPEYSTRKCAKVLVVGVSENVGRRMLFEDAFTHELKREGVDALQGYLVMIVGQGLSREKVVGAVQSAGANCVITTRLQSLQEEKKLVTDYEAFMLAYPTMDITPPTVPTVASTEITVMKATVETRLFEAESAKMVWSTGAATYDFNNLEPVTKDYARSISKALKKEGMF